MLEVPEGFCKMTLHSIVSLSLSSVLSLLGGAVDLELTPEGLIFPFMLKSAVIFTTLFW